MPATDPMRPVHQATRDLRARLQRLDRDLRNIDRDQSTRPDIRQQRRQEVLAKGRAEVEQLRDSIPGAMRAAVRDTTPRAGSLRAAGNPEASASRRSLYSTRAQGLLAAGDTRALRKGIRDALRAGDQEQAQEYLAVGAQRLRSEFGAQEVSALERAATPESDRARAATHEAMRDRLGDQVALGQLHQYVDKTLERVGSGDPYDEPDPHLGAQVTMWAHRMDETAGEHATRTIAQYDQADQAVVEGD